MEAEGLGWAARDQLWGSAWSAGRRARTEALTASSAPASFVVLFYGEANPGLEPACPVFLSPGPTSAISLPVRFQ